MARTFGRNIIIDGRPTPETNTPRLRALFEQEVNDCLLDLLMFRTGRAVLDAIGGARHRVRIIPWGRIQENAEAEARDPQAATRRGAPVRDGDGRRVRGLGQGTGRGSGVLVRFTPWIHRTERLPRWDPQAVASWLAVPQGPQPVLAGWEPDEVLLHELVHALEMVTGQADGTPLDHLLDTVAEFNAIVVVNLLARERSRPFQRDHRSDREVLVPTGVHPLEGEFWRLVEEFRARHPVLCQQLAAIPVDGNPFGGQAQYRQVEWREGRGPG